MLAEVPCWVPACPAPLICFWCIQHGLTCEVQALVCHHCAVGCKFSTRPRLLSHVVQGAPLVVLNSFSGEEHLKLATVLFQNLFPSINVQNMQLHQCQVTTLAA